MIRKLAVSISLFFYFSGISQVTINKTITSEFLQDTRDIRIYLPEGYEVETEKNYPLAIVLDAEYLFDLYIGNSVLFAKKDKAPQQIVVGITMAETRAQDTYFNKNTGKLTLENSAFYKFIRDELIFEIESNYRTSPFISLIGEGTSANIVSHFLGEKEPFINSYVCINPTFSDFVNREFAEYRLKKLDKEDNSFYLYTNNSSSFSDKKQQKITVLQDFLKLFQIENLNIINDSLETDSNISAISEAIPRALTKIFEIYSAISKEEFETKIKDLSPIDAISYLENKYLEIEFLFGGSLGIRERDIYAIESIIIEKDNGDQLMEFGKMILNLFPSSPLGNYYIGMFYETGKQNKKALEQYKIGYGKMDPSDPKADAFYENVLRVGGQ
jgi:predicted alpha/beta superfamily hydrolase